jgi:hypothetical protein
MLPFIKEKHMSISGLFLVVALVLFILAAVNVPSSKINLVALGLAFCVAAALAGSV